MKKSYGALYWLLIIFITPSIIYFGLAYIFGHSSSLCLLTLPSGFIVIYLGLKLRPIIKGRTKKIDWEETKSEEEVYTDNLSTEKYSVEEGTVKKDKGIFSRIFGKEDRCDKCGSELVYKKGAGSHYCPECQEYKWD